MARVVATHPVSAEPVAGDLLGCWARQLAWRCYDRTATAQVVGVYERAGMVQEQARLHHRPEPTFADAADAVLGAITSCVDTRIGLGGGRQWRPVDAEPEAWHQAP